MALTIGDTAPDFQAETTDGDRLSEWIGDSWAVLFSRRTSRPCASSRLHMAKIGRVRPRGVKVIGSRSIRLATTRAGRRTSRRHRAPHPATPSSAMPTSRSQAVWDARRRRRAIPATAAADNQTVRNVFVIGPDKKIKLVLVYPMTTGRNFDEVLRVLDSLQQRRHRVSTPVNWKQGDDVIIAGRLQRRSPRDLRRGGGAEALHPDRAPTVVVRSRRTGVPVKAGTRTIWNHGRQPGANRVPAAQVGANMIRADTRTTVRRGPGWDPRRRSCPGRRASGRSPRRARVDGSATAPTADARQGGRGGKARHRTARLVLPRCGTAHAPEERPPTTSGIPSSRRRSRSATTASAASS